MARVKLKSGDNSLIGKTLATDVVSNAGHYLLGKGITITSWHLKILQNHEILAVDLMETSTIPVKLQIKEIFKDRESVFTNYYDNLLEIKDLFQKAVSREVPNLQAFMKPFLPMAEEILKGKHILLELHHIRGYDEYTYRHSINVGLLAATIGRILNLSNESSIYLGKLGFFHDIGKMKVSQQVLNKPGSLSEEEFEEIKKHTIYGKEIIDKIHGTDNNLSTGALYHHERIDGSGYPFGLMKDKIPLAAQIIAVADTYDAVSSDRVYRTKTSPFFALEVLINDAYKGVLNANIVMPFVKHIIEGYIGNIVILSDDRRGSIVHLSREEIDKPLLLVNGEFIDLKKQRNLFITHVYSKVND